MRTPELLSRIASSFLSEGQKRRIRSVLRKATAAYVKRFRSYDADQLVAALHDVGVVPDAVVMVHSSYSPFNGFRGSPAAIVAALERAIGPGGTLLMPSFPYSSSLEEYVRTGASFDVRRTASRMGIVSEMFRRQEGTKRSRNPAHPILARGPLAAWFIEGHENCLYSCGPGSPFQRMVEANAKALFLDVSFSHLTFFHYLEHSISHELGFPLYVSESQAMQVIDENGRELMVHVRPFSSQARAARRFSILERELRQRGLVRDRRVGNTDLMTLNVRDAQDVTRELASHGVYFYDPQG